MKLDFKTKVFFVVKNISQGKTLNYDEVAEKSGSHQACRAIRTILVNNTDKFVPYYRIIRSDGRL